MINKITKLKDFISDINSYSKLLFADVNSDYKLKLEDIENRQSISILIGPEGDFSPQERELILARYKGKYYIRIQKRNVA